MCATFDTSSEAEKGTNTNAFDTHHEQKEAARLKRNKDILFKLWKKYWFSTLIYNQY